MLDINVVRQADKLYSTSYIGFVKITWNLAHGLTDSGMQATLCILITIEKHEVVTEK